MKEIENEPLLVRSVDLLAVVGWCFIGVALLALFGVTALTIQAFIDGQLDVWTAVMRFAWAFSALAVGGLVVTGALIADAKARR